MEVRARTRVGGWPLHCLLWAVFGFGAGARAAPPECASAALAVLPGTPVFAGAGFGFPAVAIFPDAACTEPLRSSADGAFALVNVPSGPPGWVPRLSHEAWPEAVPPAVMQSTPSPRVALLAVALRSAPRVDARAVSIVPAGATLEVGGDSDDGLWLWARAAGSEGWLPRYQSAETMPSPGTAPKPSAGRWRVRGEHSSDSLSPESPIAPRSAAGSASAAQAAQVSEGPGGREISEEGLVSAEEEAGAHEEQARQSAAPFPSPAAAAPMLGRTLEVALFGGIASWQQRYLSDAQNDPYYRYVVDSLGGSGGFSLSRRGHDPWVFDARASAAFFGFDLPAGAAGGGPEPLRIGVSGAEGAASVGFRIFGSERVDLEGGLGIGAAATFFDPWRDERGADPSAFASGVHWQVLRPSAALRNRLGGGQGGLLVVEAALPLSAYAFLEDPGTRYLDARAAGRVAPPPPATEAFAGNEAAEAASLAAVPPLLHLGVGMEVQLRYQLPLSRAWQLEGYLAWQARQAWIEGPGLRVSGAYARAVVIEQSAQAGLGLRFGL